MKSDELNKAIESALAEIENNLRTIEALREFVPLLTHSDKSVLYGRMFAMMKYADSVLSVIRPQWGGVSDLISVKEWLDAEVRLGLIEQWRADEQYEYWKANPPGGES